MSWKEVASKVYGDAARVVFGVGLVLVLLNLIATPILRSADDQVTRRYGADLVLAAYPGLDAADVKELLRETWSRAMVYAPFVQYEERPFSGRFVKVTEYGYRESSEPGPWPPEAENLNVFLFGGSTTFGYGVSDAQTIASYLEPLLEEQLGARPVECYNFGRGSYYSSQERTLFSELLIRGIAPDVAIFVDGINEFLYDAPYLTGRLSGLIEERLRSVAEWAIISLPLTKLGLMTLGIGIDPRKDPRLLDDSYNDTGVITARIGRYLENIRMTERIARAYGVTPIFVVQPTPVYKYDVTHHPFAAWGFGRHSQAAFAYPQLAERLQREDPVQNLIWAADVLESLHEPLFVDLIHYSPKLSSLLAAEISRQIGRRSLLEHHPRPSRMERTAARRASLARRDSGAR